MSVYRTSRRAHVQSSRKVTLYLGCVRVRIGLGGLRWSLLPLAKSNANILSQYSLYQEFDFAAAFRLALRNQTRPSVVSVQFVPGMYSISHYRVQDATCLRGLRLRPALLALLRVLSAPRERSGASAKKMKKSAVLAQKETIDVGDVQWKW
eukprot:326372-Rhodomonas_salina.1